MISNRLSKMIEPNKENPVAAHGSFPLRQPLRQGPADQEGSTASKLLGSDNPSRSYASSIEEAQTLVRQCAKPHPAGDKVQAAILRASRRLQLPFNRTRDIWYCQARRIDADEMDRLRRGAENTELAHAIFAIQVLRNRMLASRSPASHEVVAGLDAALRALGRD
jgi:hypothetical protein